MQLFGFIFLAVTIEGIITYVKTFFADGIFHWKMLVGISLGILCAIAFDIDLFAYAGMTSSIPFLGDILTGILLSRGSNYAFDLLNKLTEFKKANS